MATLYSTVESIHQEISNKLTSGVARSEGSKAELEQLSALCDQLKNDLISEDEFKAKILNVKTIRNTANPNFSTFNDFLNRIGTLCQ